MVPGLTKPGQLLAMFLLYQARGKPIGQVLDDWEFYEGKKFKRGTPLEEKKAAIEAAKSPKQERRETDRPKQPAKTDLSTRQTDLERYGNKEVQPLPLDWPKADGKDRRLWTEVIEEETTRVIGVIEGEVHEHALNPIEATSIFRAINHMVTAVIAAGCPDDQFVSHETGRPPRKPGECNGQLMILYRQAAWRDWMRATLCAYLIRKEKAAQSEIDLQLYGDVPSEAEEASQEPVHQAENESQLVAAPAGPPKGDAFEGDD